MERGEHGQRHQEREVYDHLRSTAESSKHGLIFDIRDYDDDPYGILQLDHALLHHIDNQDQRDTTLHNFLPALIPTKDLERLADVLGVIYRDSEVADHLGRGGSVAFVTNHRSYADQPALMAASALADPENLANHTTITHRLIGLFKVPYIGFKVMEGGIGTDGLDYGGLMQFGNVIQTFPASESGKDPAVKHVRKLSNYLAAAHYHRLIGHNHGSQKMFIAASGTQEKLRLDGKLHMGKVGKGTVDLLTRPNQEENRLMVFPMFMDCNPFQPDGMIAAHHTPFTILPFIFPREPGDIEHMMHEIAAAGNRVKRLDTPEFVYG